ncbi:cilia- and flagella-associated protein 157 isoform X2 [Dunckerocampus dactyliophorus]|uniref:cilia- and flagella-associated protein 157 isoform X2 n=1 Tax=Dunckerocampus dactyliophorus TaxID=161453 RepID=UPI002406D52C|nr:cilia- and flagella-associated protein 157 isoform X2 [Dunckerocampus dactyliophorus]
MPKKKEKKNGDRKDEDKKKTKTTQSQSAPAEENGKEKDLYLIQIGFLNEQLERYKLKCEGLSNEKEALSCQCSALEKEKKDIVDYLKRSLLEKEDELDEMSERLQAWRREADKDKDALRLQLDRERREVGERIDELEEDNVKLVARLAAVEEFEKQKEQMWSEMELLEKQLAREEEEHAAAMHAVEMKSLLEKSRLANQMEARAAADVERLVERRLPETARRAARENEEVKARYGVLSEKAHDLARENAALREQKSRLAADVDVLEQTLAEMSRQSCVRKKEVPRCRRRVQAVEQKRRRSGSSGGGATAGEEEEVRDAAHHAGSRRRRQTGHHGGEDTSCRQVALMSRSLLATLCRRRIRTRRRSGGRSWRRSFWSSWKAPPPRRAMTATSPLTPRTPGQEASISTSSWPDTAQATWAWCPHPL